MPRTTKVYRVIAIFPSGKRVVLRECKLRQLAVSIAARMKADERYPGKNVRIDTEEVRIVSH